MATYAVLLLAAWFGAASGGCFRSSGGANDHRAPAFTLQESTAGAVAPTATVFSPFTPVPTGSAARAVTPTASPAASGRPAFAATAATATRGPTVAPASTASVLDSLTLEEKIGQMLMYGFDGTGASDSIVELIERRHAGNVVLLGQNVSDPAQLRALTGGLQQLARDANGGIGLLISTDQEGGSVARLLPPSFAPLPSARQMAAAGNPNTVTGYGAQTGQELRGVGINLDLAPVLDVNDNPANPVIGDRAFGVDVPSVLTYGLAFLNGLHQGGVAAVAKHFPGHGNTSEDSHLTLPYVYKTDPQLRAVELAPFAEAISRGVDAVMVDHVVYPAWDPAHPASLSQPIVTGILRNQLGYQGVVMTDDMNMAAITDEYGPGEAAVMAVQAGIDILLTGGPASLEAAMADALVQAVRSGRISEARMNQSVARILALKRRYGLCCGEGR